jgi:hypothetical protein
MSVPDILPDCRSREARNIVFRHGVAYQPIYCANCGKDAGFVPAETSTFAFYLCDAPCAEQWGPLAGTMVEPDTVFWAKLKAAQLEHYGRELTEQEILAELNNESSIIATLAKEK